MNQKKKLIEDKNDLIIRMQKILDQAKDEDRPLTEEEDKNFKDLNAEIDKIDNTIKALEIVKARTPMEPVGDDGNPDPEDKNKADRKKFENLLRSGKIQNGMSKDSHGVLVPETIVDEIIEQIYEESPILKKINLYHEPGSIVIPIETDGITVDYAEDFVALTPSSDTVTSVKLTPFLAGALVQVGKSLINNTKFDIVSHVISKMAKAIARWIEKKLIVGDENIEGLSGATNVVTAGAATVITADDLVQTQDSVKSGYQKGACWLMNSKTRTKLRLLKGNDGHYLLNDNIASPFGSDLLGKPVYLNDDMPDIAAEAKAIIYGDPSGLSANMPEKIEIATDDVVSKHEIDVVGYFEIDAKVSAQQAFAVLQMAASDPEPVEE